MSRTNIKPIRVIETQESSHGPATTVVHTIVAIDRDANKAWSDKNVQLELSDVESWPRPMDDVFMQPVQPISTTTIGADGKTFTETLMPTKPAVQPVVEQQKTDDKLSNIVATTQHRPQTQQKFETAIANSQTSPLVDALIDKLLTKSSDDARIAATIKLTAKIDIAKLVDVASILDIEPAECIEACIRKGIVQSVKIYEDN